MMVKCRIGIVIFLIAGMLSSAAIADGNAAQYELYLNKARNALKQKFDKTALRYFIIAQILNPSAAEPDEYIQFLTEHGVRLNPLSQEDRVIGYQYYMSQGIEAYDNHKYEKASRCFVLAKIFDPSAPEADKYLKRLQYQQPAVPAATEPPMQSVQSSRLETIQAAPKAAAVEPEMPLVKGTQPVYVGNQKSNRADTILFLSDLASSAAEKPSIRLELGSAIILEGNNIQRFLLTDDNFIKVKKLSSNQIQIVSLKIGSTFLHVWDDNGRRTIYVQVIFPKVSDKEQGVQPIALSDHVRPFRFLYGNDWSTYYFGEGSSSPNRQSLDFRQDYAIDGDTSYGFLDASFSTIKYNAPTEVLTYTVGLTNIPLEGTSEFNLRAFDTRRYLTPLTLPATLLRGVSADFHVLDDLVGVSLSTGRKISSYGFVSVGGNKREDFIDAAQIVLFPHDEDHHYSVNFARGYGDDHPDYVTKQVYSVEGVHKIDDVTLSGELARDGSNTAALAGIKLERGIARTAVHIRDINKNFTNISNYPSNQGEVGATWTTNVDAERFSTETDLDVYRNLLFFNQEAPDAFNYDANANLRMTVSDDAWIETNVFYVDTPGEISPRRNFGIHQRLSHYFDVWGGRKGTVYGGGTYQRSRYQFSPQSQFDRYSILVGVQVPLTSQLSSFANYEFSWLKEPFMGGRTNPSVYNTGIAYNKQFNDRFSINSQLTFRKEQGVKGTNSFLSGQDSAGVTVGFAYNPKPDLSIYGDGGIRRVWAHLDGDQSYNDADVHLGVRMIFDVFPGIDPRGNVSGYVYKDRNANGKYDAGEPGVPGVKVKIGEKETTTDQDGKYSLSVRAKAVLVVPAVDSVPSGFMFATATSARVNIQQGKVQRVDFGLTSQTGVYGVVYVDKNGNGIPDSGDQFCNRVKLILDNESTEFTDNTGAYFFRNIAEGSHTVVIDMSSLPMNLIPLVKVKNAITVSEGSTYVFHVPMSVKEGVDAE